MQNRKFKKLSTFIAATMLSVVTIGTTAFASPQLLFDSEEGIGIEVHCSNPNPDKPEKLFLFSTPCVILKKKGVFICYSLINTLIKFMASLPVMTA